MKVGEASIRLNELKVLKRNLEELKKGLDYFDNRVQIPVKSVTVDKTSTPLIDALFQKFVITEHPSVFISSTVEIIENLIKEYERAIDDAEISITKI